MFEIFDWAQLDRFIKTFVSTMISVAKRAVKLPFLYNVFVFVGIHLLYTLSARCLLAAYQVYGFSALKIEGKLALCADKV